MQYKVNWFEKKTSQNGREYGVLNIEGQQGEVSVWPDFPGYAEIAPGSSVEGVIVQKGKYYNLVSENRPTGNVARQGGSFGAKLIKEKQEGIREAQETKHEAIKEAGAQRDAVLIVTTFYPEFANDPLLSSEKEKVIKEKYLQWRDFFLNQDPFANKQL